MKVEYRLAVGSILNGVVRIQAGWRENNTDCVSRIQSGCRESIEWCR